jgi:hypothetical protein
LDGGCDSSKPTPAPLNRIPPPNPQSNVKNNAHIRERIAKKLSLILPKNPSYALLSGENVSRETFLFLMGCDFFAAGGAAPSNNFKSSEKGVFWVETTARVI